MKFSNTIIMLLGVLIALKILIFRILPFIKQYFSFLSVRRPKSERKKSTRETTTAEYNINAPLLDQQIPTKNTHQNTAE